MRRIRAAALAVAAAGIAVLGFGSPAAAADGKQLATDAVGPGAGQDWHCTYGSANAVGCFAPYGEWFRIADSWADGYPVVIEWRFFDDEVSPVGAIVREGTIWNTAGQAAGWRYVNKSFPENQPGITLKQVTFRACSGNYPANAIYDATCSEWITVGT
ncbi:hypothetical protein [Dactylosporangium sp. CA-233914]|uniref:hypothetical protein n=1 Tax=Dactylosporangium sp. CA-233914 TaxID=3239934 RepID=UPI003D8A7355